jgi:predicted nucleic acid-binding protein
LALVLNATPLIYLSRSGGLQILKSLKTRIYTPKAVYEEVVVEGRRLGKPGADLVDQYVREGVITVRSPKLKMKLSSKVTRAAPESDWPVDEGEAEVLALAQEMNCTAIIDEQVGRNLARLHGIEVHGTVYLLILAHNIGALTKDQTLAMFKRIVAEGWRISVEDYTAIMEELEQL